MPHDRNGRLLSKGDEVIVRAKISEIWTGEEYCNVNLSIGGDAPHGPHNVTSSLTVNAKQVELVQVEAESQS